LTALIERVDSHADQIEGLLQKISTLEGQRVPIVPIVPIVEYSAYIRDLMKVIAWLVENVKNGADPPVISAYLDSAYYLLEKI